MFPEINIFFRRCCFDFLIYYVDKLCIRDGHTSSEDYQPPVVMRGIRIDINYIVIIQWMKMKHHF